MPELFYVEEIKDRPRTPWNFKKSFFATYKLDNEKLLNECFEFDWSMIKLPKNLIPDSQLLALKTYLRQ